MKNTFKTKLILFSFIILLFFSPFCLASDATDQAIATTFETENQIEKTYELIASDVYKFDTNITIENTIDGNVFAFGNNIIISGEIGGDVFAFGKNISFTDTAYIHGNIFVFGSNVTMNGICYDVYACSEKFTLDSDAIIARDLKVATETLHINGNIKRDAYVYTNNLKFSENASSLISGNLNYIASSKFEIPEGIVLGNINFTPNISDKETIGDIISNYVFDILSAIVYSLAVVLLTIWLAPKFVEKSSNLLKKKAPLSLGVGLLTCIIIVAASFTLLFITAGLGVGISFAAITIFVLALTISKTVFGIACAKLISNKFKSNHLLFVILFTLLTVLAISLLELIPYIGGIIGFVTSMIGLGIIVLNLILKKEIDDNKEKVSEISE